MVERAPVVTIMGHVDMVKQPFLIPFVTHVLRLEKLVESHSILVPTKLKRVVRKSPSLILQDTQPLHLCVPVVLLLQILLS